MKRLIIPALAIALAVPATAAEEKPVGVKAMPRVEVVSIGADGKPDVVRIDGIETKICKGDVKDSCINPQDAGFDWGGTEINYWPGRPASEIDGKLPVDKPAEEPAQTKDPG